MLSSIKHTKNSSSLNTLFLHLSRKKNPDKTCQCQLFLQLSWKSAGDCMRNANKSPKIRYSTMVKEAEKWSGIRVWDWTTTTS